VSTWTKVQYNEILDGDGFFLSYLGNERDPLTTLVDAIATGGHQGPETAIVVEVDGKREHYILRGDHREELGNRVGSLDECIAYFNAHVELAGWSSDFPHAHKVATTVEATPPSNETEVN
jgi:hypothetical protein